MIDELSSALHISKERGQFIALVERECSETNSSQCLPHTQSADTRTKHAAAITVFRNKRGATCRTDVLCRNVREFTRDRLRASTQCLLLVSKRAGMLTRDPLLRSMRDAPRMLSLTLHVEKAGARTIPPCIACLTMPPPPEVAMTPDALKRCVRRLVVMAACLALYRLRVLLPSTRAERDAPLRRRPITGQTPMARATGAARLARALPHSFHSKMAHNAIGAAPSQPCDDGRRAPCAREESHCAVFSFTTDAGSMFSGSKPATFAMSRVCCGVMPTCRAAISIMLTMLF